MTIARLPAALSLRLGFGASGVTEVGSAGAAGSRLSFSQMALNGRFVGGEDRAECGELANREWRRRGAHSIIGMNIPTHALVVLVMSDGLDEAFYRIRRARLAGPALA